MSYPAEDTLEGLYRNRIEDVAAFLDSRHRRSHLVLNLSERPYSAAKLPAIELGFPHEFLNRPMTRQVMFGGVHIERR